MLTLSFSGQNNQVEEKVAYLLIQMGLSFSWPLANMNDLDDHIESIMSKSLSFKENNVKTLLRSLSFDDQCSSKLAKVRSFKSSMMIRGSLSFNGRELKRHGPESPSAKPLPEPKIKRVESLVSELKTQGPESPSAKAKPLMNRDLAAVKLQKTYKSFRTRRQLADCAVLVEQRWWKLLDFAQLKCSSVSFFEVEKPETVVSRWSRARTRAAKRIRKGEEGGCLAESEQMGFSGKEKFKLSREKNKHGGGERILFWLHICRCSSMRQKTR
ncbi:hypothetical protein L1987_33660 [Smallanthus sonchifolius]|uniref:Uncharacterized protein n=1 Tax=Smallanthus sonchifolius TaxID=185202 RepID=A0ACB9HT12_9ASTR|nr:hypothetical protein L1987_33660 [Smallanthus sonchifolius]